MKEAVLDASVVLKWFSPNVEGGSVEAEILRAEFRAGRLLVVVPALVFIECLNAAGRGWRMDSPSLAAFAMRLKALLFEVAEPDLVAVSAWVARGLTAYDATYVALAEMRGVALVTTDRQIVAVAPEIAIPLSAEP